MKYDDIAACTLGLRMLELGSALDELKALGYRGADLWQVSPYRKGCGHIAANASAEDRARVKALAAERGIRYVGLASYPGLHFRKAAENERQKDLEWARRTVDLCVDLDIPLMRCLTGRGEDIDDLPTLVRSLQETADYAAERGIRIVLETHDRTPVFQVEWIREIFETTDRPNLGLLYDAGNLGPNDLYKEVLEAFKSRVFHVHVRNVMLDDSGRRTVCWAHPSHGVVDYHWVFDMLDDVGYTGAVAVEYEALSHEGTLAEARDGLKQWMAFFASRTR